MPFTSTFTIHNALVVLADREIHGGLRVEAGIITDIWDAGSPSAAFPPAHRPAHQDAGGNGEPDGPVMDFEGDILTPGLVELHTDNLERHLVPRPNVFWPALPALTAHDMQVAGAGITTVFDAVSLGDRAGKEERLQYLDQAVAAITEAQDQGLLRSDHFLHLRCEVPKPDVVALYRHYAQSPWVRLISLMDHTPGDRQFPDIARLKELSINHYGESPADFDERVKLEKESQRLHAVPNRSAIAADALSRGLVLASHDDAKPDHIDEATELGITISEFPTTIAAAQAARDKGMTTIMGAPNVIRGGSHSGNVAAMDLADRGLLDALSSDYVPVSLVNAPFRIARELGWPLHQAMALVTANPARMGGLGDRGQIAPGLRADLLRIRMAGDQAIVRATWRAGYRVA